MNITKKKKCIKIYEDGKNKIRIWSVVVIEKVSAFKSMIRLSSVSLIYQFTENFTTSSCLIH